MAHSEATSRSNTRPKAIHTSHSFPRMDASPLSPSRKSRSNTVQEQAIPAVPAANYIESASNPNGNSHIADIFENQSEDESVQPAAGASGPELKLPSSFDDLPVEIRSLTERFLDGLSVKTHPTPLSADALSELFQDFYERAAAHIAQHIASLSSRIGRERSPMPSPGVRNSKGRSRAGSGATRSENSPSNSGGEMLTASEVADRKRARRMLELKRTALEEAVERAGCEKVYDKIYKHKSSDDDARDEKLRSRTAALAVVGIGLKELHVDTAPNELARKTTADNEEEIHHSLAEAREALQRMDDEHYPLGKLQHLTAAHKSIVETLSELFPSSSSADEILPTLIYTLITCPPEGINVVSNLNFIQRFRASSKVDGEAAYCMVNLEAAISFLETIDLPSLRAEELPEGPPKISSGLSTPTVEKNILLPEQATAAPSAPAEVTKVSAMSRDTASASGMATKSLPAQRRISIDNARHQRRISAMMQAQADRLEAGRENLLNTADKIYDSINGTLENSFQFVFGRFKDQMSDGSPLPKTLEDARKLVSSPRVEDEDDALDLSGRSSPGPEDPLTSGGRGEKVVEMIAGRKQLRDRSVDSSRSGGSGKRVAFAHEQAAKERQKEEVLTPTGNLFANINPLNRFNVPNFAPSFAPSFGRFGRAASVPTTSKDPPLVEEKVGRLGGIAESPDGSRAATVPASEKHRGEGDVDDDLNARETLAELRRLKPPKKRFLEIQTAGELRLSEIDELLLDYRRLAKAIGEAIAS